LEKDESYRPKAILVDYDPEPIDHFMAHAGSKRLFNEDCIVKGHTTSLGVWSDVHYVESKSSGF
jgi:hypothetical protein